MRNLFCLLVFILLVIFESMEAQSKKDKEVIIFHAGSLSVPFKELAREYEKRNPGVEILLEPAGSIVCARKVTELKKPCDIVASADYFVINELLIPAVCVMEYTVCDKRDRDCIQCEIKVCIND